MQSKVRLSVLLLTLFTMLCVVSFTACGKNDTNTENSGAVTITNSIGGVDYDITYDKVPERAISGAGFTTEMLLALGLEDKMVGQFFLDNPVRPEYEEAYSKVKNLGEDTPSKEVFLAEKPDFFTGWVADEGGMDYDFEFLESNGIKPYAPKADSKDVKVESIFEDLENYGKIFHVEDRATELVSGMKDLIAETEEKIEGTEPVRVFVYDSGGKDTLTIGTGLCSEMITIAGGENIFDGDFENWGTVNWETVLAEDPQYILITDYNMSEPVEDKIEFLTSAPELQGVDAIKNKRFLTVRLTDVTGGVGVADSIREMAEFFHPESF